MVKVMAVFTACVLVVKKAYIQAILLIILVPIWVQRFYHFSVAR